MEGVESEVLTPEEGVLPMDEGSTVPPEVVPIEASVRGKRRRRSAKPAAVSKPSPYPPHSLHLCNKEVVPAFTQPGARPSKRDLALHKTRLLCAWANYYKPLGTVKGKNPFIKDRGTTLSELKPLPSQGKGKKKGKAAAVKEPISAFTSPLEPSKPGKGGIEEEDIEEASTVSIASLSYQQDVSAASRPLNLVSGCVTAIVGEGVVHTKYIDLQNLIFFRENKFPSLRRQILREELERVKGGLKRLQQEAQARLGERHKQSGVRRVVVAPHRSGGVAVGNAKVGLARPVVDDSKDVSMSGPADSSEGTL